MSVYLGLDVGTSGTKVLAIEESGRILSSATVEYPCYAPRPLWSEQDPVDWWNAVVRGVREARERGGFRGADVKGIGLSGQMHGSVFLDGANNVIRPGAGVRGDRNVGRRSRRAYRHGGEPRDDGLYGAEDSLVAQ